MSGSKTRFGFSGAHEPSHVEGQAPEVPRAARTFIGHETHRPGEVAPPKAAPKIEVEGAATTLIGPVMSVPPGVPEAVMQEEFTERVPGRGRHTGKSRFPAIARLFGRWTTGGHFRSGGGAPDDGTLPEIPRNLWASRIVIFLGAALLSFLIALAAMKLAG